jgi:hypothetical protein
VAAERRDLMYAPYSEAALVIRDEVAVDEDADIIW